MTLRERHLLTLANHVLSHLDTWASPADWGISSPEYSANEVLSIIGCPKSPEDEDYSDEARAYARSLWDALGPYLRNLGAIST